MWSKNILYIVRMHSTFKCIIVLHTISLRYILLKSMAPANVLSCCDYILRYNILGDGTRRGTHVCRVSIFSKVKCLICFHNSQSVDRIITTSMRLYTIKHFTHFK